tara:strand:- start:186 stop:377 length:192 start_codon:yes stop_codon:yes gene_type:complete
MKIYCKVINFNKVNKTGDNDFIPFNQEYLGGGKWSKKYKKSINCKKPKGFSQKQYCKHGRKKK